MARDAGGSQDPDSFLERKNENVRADLIAQQARVACNNRRLADFHPQITLTAFRAISLSSARRAPARARIAMLCMVADAKIASAAGSASGFSSPFSRAVRKRA